MNRLLPFIEQKGMAILDGGLATELEAQGIKIKGERLWASKCVLTHGDKIKKAHLDYLDAGADVITTCTYQASVDLLEQEGIKTERDIQHFNRKAVSLAKQAIEEHVARRNQSTGRAQVDGNSALVDRPLIAYSIGSYGASLGGGKEYGGDYGVSIAELFAFHKKRLRYLTNLEDVDLIAFETIPCRRETVAIVEILKEFPRFRCWISFSCRNDEEISDGTSIVDLIKLINSSKQVIAVGVNCTAPEHIESLVKKIACRTTKVVVAYPNKGETYDAQLDDWKPNSQKVDWTDLVIRWKKMGLGMIGGCCRTTPADIRKIHRLIMEDFEANKKSDGKMKMANKTTN